MGINQTLEKLYSEHWHDLELEAKKIDNITHPLLLKVDEDRIDEAEIKVMIFGQETDGWFGEFPKGSHEKLSISSLMDNYENYFKHSTDKNRRPFWKRTNFKYFEEEISDYCDNKNKKSYFLWNNISKIGKTTRGCASWEIRKLELSYLNVIEREVSIIDPDIIIFTTGHSRDRYILDAFGENNVEFEHPKISFHGTQVEYETKKIISKVMLSNYPKITAVRTEHPNRRTLEKEVIYQTIIQMLDAT